MRAKRGYKHQKQSWRWYGWLKRYLRKRTCRENKRDWKAESELLKEHGG